jgi:hypothetical protein
MTPCAKRQKHKKNSASRHITAVDDFHLGLTPNLRNLGLESRQIDSCEANRDVSPASSICWSGKGSEFQIRYSSPAPRNLIGKIFDSASSMEKHIPESHRRACDFASRYIQSPAMFDCGFGYSNLTSSTPSAGQFDVDISAILSPSNPCSSHLTGLKIDQSASGLDILAEIASAQKLPNGSPCGVIESSPIRPHGGFELLSTYLENEATESSGLVQPEDQSFASFIELHENLDSNCASTNSPPVNLEPENTEDIAIDFPASGKASSLVRPYSTTVGNFSESTIEACKSFIDELNCAQTESFNNSPAVCSTAGNEKTESDSVSGAFATQAAQRELDISASDFSAAKRKKVEMDSRTGPCNPWQGYTPMFRKPYGGSRDHGQLSIRSAHTLVHLIYVLPWLLVVGLLIPNQNHQSTVVALLAPLTVIRRSTAKAFARLIRRIVAAGMNLLY